MQIQDIIYEKEELSKQMISSLNQCLDSRSKLPPLEFFRDPYVKIF